MVIVCTGPAEKQNSLAYRRDLSGTARKRIARYHERLILVLCKGEVHTGAGEGTGEMVERIAIIISHIISHSDVS